MREGRCFAKYPSTFVMTTLIVTHISPTSPSSLATDEPTGVTIVYKAPAPTTKEITKSKISTQLRPTDLAGRIQLLEDTTFTKSDALELECRISDR